jgi:hypothetical protein
VAFPQFRLVLADGDRPPGGAGGHVTVEAHPVGGRVVAGGVPVLASGELSRVAGELELELVDGLAEADQGERVGEGFLLGLQHAGIISN